MNMALRINPYTPGVGMMPRYLAGREALLEEAKDTLAYVANGYATRSLVYYGLRGVGKTVLLTKIESIAKRIISITSISKLWKMLHSCPAFP